VDQPNRENYVWAILPREFLATTSPVEKEIPGIAGCLNVRELAVFSH
jgi:hypothetical protein